MRKFWHSVHTLRGLAALLVVAHHVPQYLRTHGFPTIPQFEVGAFGVDIFFAISGFVMFFASKSEEITSIKFLRDRAIRILPLYWIITLTLGLTSWLIPSIFSTFTSSVETIAKSIFFVPTYGEKGLIRPILSMGWTLYYEIFFYIITAIFLYASYLKFNRALIAATAIAASSLIVLTFTENTNNSALQLLAPISIEFLFGTLIGFATEVALRSDGVTPRHVLKCLFTIPFAGYLLITSIPENININVDRLLFWGIPGALILISFISLEPLFNKLNQKFPSFSTIGDASYAIYLVHGISFSLSGKIIKSLGVNSTISSAIPLFFGALTLGILTHIHVEKPIQKKLSSLFKD